MILLAYNVSLNLEVIYWILGFIIAAVTVLGFIKKSNPLNKVNSRVSKLSKRMCSMEERQDNDNKKFKEVDKFMKKNLNDNREMLRGLTGVLNILSNITDGSNKAEAKKIQEDLNNYFIYGKEADDD